MPIRLSILLVACLLGTSCSILQRGTTEADLTSRGTERAVPSRSVWVDASQVLEAGRTPADAEALLAEKRRSGFDSVFLMVRDEAGSLAFRRSVDAIAPYDARDCPNCLDNFILASETTGVAVVAAYPVFLGRPARGEEPIEYAWDSVGGRAELRPREIGEETIPRRNPAIPEIQAGEMANLIQLARTGVGEICLTHLGFSGPRADFSADARAGVETIGGRRLPDWPEEVVSFVTAPDANTPIAMPGPAWGDWVRWRARVLQRFVQFAREATSVAATSEGHAPPRLHLMATGYYPLHSREGLNWAARGAEVRVPWPEAPDEYESTGTADYVAGIVLEAFLPAVTVDDARALGIEDWASIEGAILTANRLVPRETERAILLSPAVFAESEDDEAFRNAQQFISQRGWSIVIVE